MIISSLGVDITKFADFVRHEGLSPPHWRRTGADRWDDGYEKTAYFLDWIENRHGEGTIRQLNRRMKDRKYHAHVFKELTGSPVHKLWSTYCKTLEEPVSIDDFTLVQQALDGPG